MNKLVLLVIIFFCSLSCNAQVLKDELVENGLIEAKSLNIHTKYNYENFERIPIKLSVVEKIKSEKHLYEGQKVEFRVYQDVVYRRKILVKAGTIVPVKVNTIITSGMNGIPASIIFSDFEFSSLDRNKLVNRYEVFGQDRSLIVFPLKWALTILPPSGSLTNFIMGGHAKLSPKKKITIYYYPNWI